MTALQVLHESRAALMFLIVGFILTLGYDGFCRGRREYIPFCAWWIERVKRWLRRQRLGG